MGYKWLNGYQTQLTSTLAKDGRLLTVDSATAAALAVKLDADYTYLVINDGTGAEVVKAIAFGNQVQIDRAQEGTEANAYPAGSCVRWEVTKSGIEDTVCDNAFKCSQKVKCGQCESTDTTSEA